MKKKILVLAAAALMLTATVSGTLAYFTDQDTAHNVITSGGVNIEIVEKTDDNGTEIEFPVGGLTGIMPGAEASKIVQIKNSGANNAWIRASVSVEVTGRDGGSLPNTPVSYNYTKGDWEEHDGFYYYNKIVEPEGLTGKLFDTVTFARTMSNEYQGCTVKIIVSADAVQSDNNPLAEGAEITSVWHDSDGNAIEILPEKPADTSGSTGGANPNDPDSPATGGANPNDPDSPVTGGANPNDPDSPDDGQSGAPNDEPTSAQTSAQSDAQTSAQN